MKHILLVLLTSYLVLVLLMYFFQRQMLYKPSIEPENSNYEVLIIDSKGLKIIVLVNNSQLEQSVIYFGGNGENVYEAPQRMQSAFEGRAAYYVNYPGYGGSGGAPTESTIIQAAKDVYAYVTAHHHSVALVGRSLGTGVAIKLASEYIVPKLVLISPYDSIADLAFNHYPFFPARLLIKDKFENISQAAKISSKILNIIAAEDTVIPLQHSQKFIDALKSTQSNTQFEQRVTTQIYTDVNHNNLHLHPSFMPLIHNFLLD